MVHYTNKSMIVRTLILGFVLISLQACATTPVVVAQASDNVAAADTVRLAVLPFVQAGFSMDESDAAWSNGLSAVMAGMMSQQNNVRVSDRTKMAEIMFSEQLSRFVEGATPDSRVIEGADYIIIGSYSMHNNDNFATLQVRLFAVETGEILQTKAMNRSRLSLTSMMTFMADFMHQVEDHFGMDSIDDVDDYFPRSKKSIKLFAEASIARDRAIAAGSGEDAVGFFDIAIEKYDNCLDSAREKSLIEHEIAVTTQLREAVNATLN